MKQTMANRRWSTDSDRPAILLDPWQELAIISAMASQTSPNGHYSHHGHPSTSTTYGNGSENASDTSGKSPLSMSLGFLKNLTEKKTTRGIYYACSGRSMLNMLYS